jgi:hypothetical protein
VWAGRIARVIGARSIVPHPPPQGSRAVVSRVDSVSNGLSVIVFVVLSLALLILVLAVRRSHWVPRPILEVDGSSSEPFLVVTVGHSRCEAGPRVLVSQSVDRVELRAEQDEGQGYDDVGLVSELRVDLDAALGDRSITVPATSRRLTDSLACRIDGVMSERCG